MMKNGSIGDVEFETSANGVFTFGGMSATAEIVFGEHDVIEGVPRLQHTGRRLDTITLPIVIDAMRPGALSFEARYSQLVKLAMQGDDVDLVLGKQYLGRWVIEKVSLGTKIQHGNKIIRGDLSLEIKEYN